MNNNDYNNCVSRNFLQQKLNWEELILPLNDQTHETQSNQSPAAMARPLGGRIAQNQRCMLPKFLKNLNGLLGMGRQ